jgi:uncharacterized membrane protein YhaH (DUF805 family)
MLLLTKRAMGETMSTRQYLFGFSGRINRAKIWLWILIVIAISIVTVAIAAIGFDWTATIASIKAQAPHGPHALHAPLDYAKVVKPGCKGVISLVALGVIALITLAYIWAKLAIYTKRLHDRGKSIWWLLLYVAAPIILHGYACHTLTGPYAHVGPHPMLHNLTLPGQIAHWAVLAIGVWVFIDLFCLKGTKGANRYGPDPLEPNWCDPEKPVKGCVPKPMKPKN